MQGLADKKRANSCLPGKGLGWVWVLGLGAHVPGSRLRARPSLRWHHRGKHHLAPHRQHHRFPAFGIWWKTALFRLLALSAKLLPDAAIKSSSLWSLHFIFLYLQRKVAVLGRNYRYFNVQSSCTRSSILILRDAVPLAARTGEQRAGPRAPSQPCLPHGGQRALDTS